MMNLKEFANYIKMALEAEFETELQIVEVNKNNRKLTGITRVFENGIAPVYYINDIYESYKCDEDYADIDELMEVVLEEFADLPEAHEVKMPITPQLLESYDELRPHLTFHLLGREGNEAVFADKIHVDLSDFVGIVYADFDEFGCAIPLDITNVVSVTAEQIISDAMSNLRASVPEKFLTIEEMIFGESIIPEPEHSGVSIPIVITNRSTNFGAALALLPEVLEAVGNRIKADFYILPSSVHELLAVKASTLTREQANSMVRDVNSEQVADADRLSDHVQLYVRASKELRRA